MKILSPKQKLMYENCIQKMFSTQCSCNSWRTRVETTTTKRQRNLIISLRNCQRERSSKMPRLSAADRNIAIGRLETGESQSAVARHFNVHHTTINRLWHRYNQFNSTSEKSGNSPISTKSWTGPATTTPTTTCPMVQHSTEVEPGELAMHLVQ